MRPAPGSLATVAADTLHALQTIRAAIKPADGTPEDAALVHLETFAATALRVFHKTNPSKLRSEARTVELSMRLDIPRMPA